MSVKTQRAFDLLLTGPAFVASLPIQLVTAAMVRRQLGSPVLFRQQRPGLGGEPFEMVKFRTMLPVDPDAGHVTDEERLTPFGKFLRETSMDELPTLWNVVKGDMSLVGPRPLLMDYLDLYTPEQARRHEVRPGLTGLAQVNGRNSISWEEKFRYDVTYVDNRSILMDLKIILKTLLRVVRRDDISAADSVTMPRFTGSTPTEGTHELPA